MNQEQSKCAKCGLSKKVEKKGSITQWISVCDCELVDEPEQNFLSLKICAVCSKRIKKSRAGSMTQWIFRSDLCDCEEPEPIDDVDKGNRDQYSDSSLTSSNIDEIEIEVSGDTFPLDRYKPIAQLGKGSVGLVYLSRDRLLGTKVALKCLTAISAEALMNFQKEAKITSKLEHPNIVKVIDFGASSSGAPYMVMEYLGGTTLKELVEKDGPLSIHDSIKVIRNICSALSYAHGKGIFHRDLTSSNILISEDNSEVKLVDFGIAMAQHATCEPTVFQGKTVAGTPGYMSPDQVRGFDYSEQSEIYSLGCVLFEALTGKVPFEGDTALEVIGMHANKKLPDLTELRGELTNYPELVSVVEKSLKKEPQYRYNSMKEFEQALQSISSGDLESGGDQLEEAPIQDRGEKRSGQTALLFLLAFLFIGCVISFTFLLNRFSSDNKEVKKKEKIAQKILKSTGSQGVDATDFSRGSLDYIIGDSKVRKSGFTALSASTQKIYCKGVTRVNFGSAMFGSCVGHITEDKVRYDWQSVMCFFIKEPDYHRLFVQDLITMTAYTIPSENYYRSIWKHDINQKVENLKLLGKEVRFGLSCKRYKCLVDGVKMEFVTTEELVKNQELTSACARILGIPPGYGMPIKAYKTYTTKQALEEKVLPVRRILDRGARRILWFEIQSLERNKADLSFDKLFPDEILNSDLPQRDRI